MAFVTFYEKPGCAGNARQKAVLMASGHVVLVRDLLAEPWRPETLRPFFGDRPVAEWFNRSHPGVKSGDVDPGLYGESEALALMCAEPLFIRRPLMESGGVRMAGFEDDKVDAWIGLKAGRPIGDDCPSEAHRCD